MVEPVTESRIWRPLTRALCGAVLVATSLSACGKEEAEKQPPTEQSQTIARVNGQEITETELEAELKRLGPVPPEQQQAIAREVLRRMVQRTVLAQKAEEANLHRTPEVMMELRRKRAETLAKAYVDQGLARQLPIAKYDVEDYVDQHPHYFAKRNHYVFDQLLIDNDLITDELTRRIRQLATLEEVEAALKEMNVRFTRRLNSNLGNQFPREAVVKIDALEPGEIFITETKDRVVVSKLVESRPQPISRENALGIARRLLTKRRDAVATSRLIDQLLANAKIEFLGSFADTSLFRGGRFAEPAPEEEEGEEKAGGRTDGEQKNAASQKREAKKANGAAKAPGR